MSPALSRYSGPLPDDMWSVLEAAWGGGIFLQSDYARRHAPTIALAASCGWLSTIEPDGQSYRGQWYVTASGLTALEHRDHFK